MRRLFAIAILPLAIASCAARTAQSEAPRGSLESPATPRPPGIALDLSARLPAAAEQANADQGVIVLSTPPERSLARRVIEDFFTAVIEENISALTELLTPDARQITDAGQHGTQATVFWSQRFEKLDYTQLSLYLIYAPSKIRSYTASEIDALKLQNRVHLSPKSDELLIIIPVVETGNGAQRKLGDILEFILAPSKDGYKVRVIYEDFRLP